MPDVRNLILTYLGCNDEETPGADNMLWQLKKNRKVHGLKIMCVHLNLSLWNARGKCIVAKRGRI